MEEKEEKKKIKIVRSKNKKSTKASDELSKGAKLTDKIPIEAQERLMKIMNDSPSLIKLKGTEWEIKGLRPAVQWLIAEEACKIVRQENASMGDVIKQFAVNLPSVCRVITLALLNDKERIDRNYQEVYDTLMWGKYDIKDWATLLLEVVSMIDINFFFRTTNSIEILRQMASERKTTMEEQKLLLQGQSGGK